MRPTYQNTYKVFDRYCVRTLLFQFSYYKDVFHASGFKVAYLYYCLKGAFFFINSLAVNFFLHFTFFCHLFTVKHLFFSAIGSETK
jgi:hypothetical protein